MKWIKTNDIKRWAEQRDCQASLPHLVRKLIRATSASIKQIKFPSAEDVQVGGLDGFLEVAVETDHTPLGISVWEFGAGKDAKSKAEKDYAKRTNNPSGYNPTESTFIFVTPRYWKDADHWAAAKRAEGKWKDVRVYNAVALDAWIELAPTVAAWLAKTHLNIPIGEEVVASDVRWNEWSRGRVCNLSPNILLGGREMEREKLYKSTQSPAIVHVRGVSGEEAVAFILACFKVESTREDDFFSRSIIVKTPAAFRDLTLHDSPLILIPDFIDTGIFYSAVEHGHTVIVPLGNDSIEEDAIHLPMIGREEFYQALVQSGLSKEKADKYTTESARNIAILRRYLKFPTAAPEWALPTNVREIIPALLVGRWSEAYDSDKAIVSKIAGVPYEEYINTLTKWLHVPDAPVIRIGGEWRVASVFDAWTHAARYLTKNDFELLKDCVIPILTEQNPALKLKPKHRPFANIGGKTKKHSRWINEGVIHSLIMTSLFADKLQVDLPINGEAWVNGIVRQLLRNDDIFFWKTITHHLPLIAEASPSEFLNAIDAKLNQNDSALSKMFEEDPGIIINQTYHTGLLWALEGLAWLPEYFTKACLILAKLTAIDPGGSTSNRPSASLLSIIRPQFYQTFAPYDQRVAALKLIARKEPIAAWKLLKAVLPKNMDAYAAYNSKMRWRMFNEDTERTIYVSEVRNTYAAVTDIMLTQFNHSEAELAELVDESTNVEPTDRDKILSFVEQAVLKVDNSQNLVWNELRTTLSQNRSARNAAWALPESELTRYQVLFDQLYPTDLVQKVSWLFEDHWPGLPEGMDYKSASSEQHQKIMDDRRISAIKSVYESFGIQKIIELSYTLKEKWILGNILPRFLDDENDILIVCDEHSKSTENSKFTESFIVHKSLANPTWGLTIYDSLVARGYDDERLAKFLCALNVTGDLWTFIDSKSAEIRKLYWLSLDRYFYGLSVDDRIRGLKYFLEFKRYATAINTCAYLCEGIPTDLLVEMLEGPGNDADSAEIPQRSHEVGSIFEAIDERGDADPKRMIALEWQFLSHLTSGGVRRKANLLHEELSTNPDFFMMMMNFIFGKDEDHEDEEKLLPQLIAARALNARELLQSWKAIPGMDSEGNVDGKVLNEWIRAVRKIAEEKDLVDLTDLQIGKLFAHYPEKTELWPCDEICDVLENVNTSALIEGFAIENYNRRSFTTRGVYDGGSIENHRAEHFHTLSMLHQIKFPAVAEMFYNISKGYRADAKEMDRRALKTSLEH